MPMEGTRSTVIIHEVELPGSCRRTQSGGLPLPVMAGNSTRQSRELGELRPVNAE